MAVSKELLARYKEMKAKGVNVTLSELKAQETSSLEAESSSSLQTNSEAIRSFASKNCTTGVNKTDVNSPVETPVMSSKYSQETAPQQQNLWTTTYSTPNTTVTSLYGNSNSSPNSSLDQNYTGNVKFSSPDTKDYISPQLPAASQYTGNVSPSLKSSFVPAPQTVRKFALIGYPLGHSLSSYIHGAGFKSLGINAAYDILETPPDTLVDRIKFLKSNNYSGFNVTIPLKLPVTMFLNDVDTSADIVNAVNTVVIDPVTKELKGYNTDVTGFRNAIPDDVCLAGKVAGILGTGGAARAAITALAQSQMKEIKLFTRNVPNSLELVNYLRERFPNVEFNTYQIERIRDLSDLDLLVNTTPIGMQGRAADMTPVEENELRTLKPEAVVYDVIYNPKKTVLLKLAQKYNYRTINGVDMFIHQAVESEKIWIGQTPDFKDMKIAALENL